MRHELPYLGKIPQKGAFPNVEAYLDINFRLLKEDFTRDLRDGIQAFMHAQGEGERALSVFKHVRMECFFAKQGVSGLALRIPFPKRMMSWLSSKKLMNGSLVLLTPDSFNTTLQAVIRNRDAKEMDKQMKKHGYVEINVELIDSDVTQVYERYGEEALVLV